MNTNGSVTFRDCLQKVVRHVEQILTSLLMEGQVSPDLVGISLSFSVKTLMSDIPRTD
jgi:hypothetical protein